MEMAVLQEVEAIARPIVDARGAYIIGVDLRGSQGGKILELFIDTDEGVSTDLCAEISRELSHALDEAAIIRSRYYLVVSSPGSDRPLRYLRQYRKHIGRRMRIRYRAGMETIRVTGELAEVKDDGIVLRTEDGRMLEVKIEAVLDSRVQTVW